MLETPERYVMQRRRLMEDRKPKRVPIALFVHRRRLRMTLAAVAAVLVATALFAPDMLSGGAALLARLWG